MDSSLRWNDEKNMVKTSTLSLSRISVRGAVQGVGFRPFVYQLAARHNLLGWVCNTSEEV
jgi:hydrogenase maturation protein HypF